MVLKYVVDSSGTSSASCYLITLSHATQLISPAMCKMKAAGLF